MTTNLGTAHFTASAPRTSTTLLSDFDSLYGTVRSAPDGSVVEQDVVFFGRPDPGALLTGSVRPLGSTLERITEYHDQTGHLVAEVFVRGSPDSGHRNRFRCCPCRFRRSSLRLGVATTLPADVAPQLPREQICTAP